MKKSDVLVSVIIVNYNAGDLLIDAVKSVMKFPHVEVIVVDNASKDGSFSKLMRVVQAANLIAIDNGANLGFGKAVNQAVKKSHGRYVYLLNPDASLSKTALMRMVETAQKYNDRAIVAPRLQNPDGSAQPSCYPQQTIGNAIREYWLGKKGAYSKYLPEGNRPVQVNAAVAAAWLISRSVWDELGGLSDKYFLYFEDLDMCDRANAAGIPIIYDPGAQVKHYHGVSSQTNPSVSNLFITSALTYHGRFKKYVIDGIIRVRDLVSPPFSWKKMAVLFAVAAIWMMAVASIGYFLLPSRYQPLPFLRPLYQSNFLIWSWANFDGEHYLRIARDGYTTVRGQSEYAFFPLYPLLIKSLTTFGLDVFLAARLISLAASLGALMMIMRWAVRHTNNPTSFLLALVLAPGSVFLAALYTEPLFLLLAAAVFYYADQRQWGKAVLLTILATATRITGVFVALFIFSALRRAGKSLAKSLGLTAVSLSGLWGYMLYLGLSVHDPLAWYHAQSGWQKANPTYPWVTLTRYFSAVTTEWAFDLTHLVVVIEIAVTIGAVLLVAKLWKSKAIDLSYKLYTTGCLLLPLATGSLGSMPRFALTLFPVYVLIPSLSKNARVLFYSLSLIISIIGIILFTRGYWYA